MVQKFPSLSSLSVVSSTTKSDSQSQKSSSKQRNSSSNQVQPQLPIRKKSNVAKFPLPPSQRTFLRPVPPKNNQIKD